MFHIDIKRILSERATVLNEQRHLDEGSAERAYWHAGYAQALRDVLAHGGADYPLYEQNQGSE